MQLISLRARQRTWQQDFFSLTMPLHTRSGLLMLYQLEKCLKVFFNSCYLLTSAWLIFCLAEPKADWTAFKGAPRMRDGVNPLTGKEQSFYFLDDHPDMPGWFKGMEQIIKERGLWPEGSDGLPAECSGFKCLDGKTNCCCRRLLFNQPDFVSQKSALQEAIESRHHLCDFYPKYHCELNFIEQYWGAAKLKFRAAGRSATIKEMEQKVKDCLDSVELQHIRR